MKHDEMLDLVRQRLVSARKESLLTQERVANVLGLNSSATISHFETGRNSTLDLRLLMQLCDLYEVDLVWVITGVSPGFDYSKLGEFHESLNNALARLEFAKLAWDKLAFPLLPTNE